ncbi:MAG TPA: DUF3551 domain-containing protein [Nitrobacter sp.]|nr:DUF3551 domain-containing protein [Nitrobacter sp.]
MRSLILASLSVAAVLTGVGISTAPASAYDYPYCLQGKRWGYPGNCQFSTYEQCQITASGTDDYCGINPRVALTRPPRYR